MCCAGQYTCALFTEVKSHLSFHSPNRVEFNLSVQHMESKNIKNSSHLYMNLMASATADYSVKVDCCVVNFPNNTPGPAKTSDTASCLNTSAPTGLMLNILAGNPLKCGLKPQKSASLSAQGDEAETLRNKCQECEEKLRPPCSSDMESSVDCELLLDVKGGINGHLFECERGAVTSWRGQGSAFSSRT